MSVRPFGKYNDEHDGVSMIILIFDLFYWNFFYAEKENLREIEKNMICVIFSTQMIKSLFSAYKNKMREWL